jgi:hypothetical protein
MIISHKHKFIFIKNRKTAGTSIEIALSSICGKHDIITPITKNDERVRKKLGFLSAQNYAYPKYKYRTFKLLKWMYRKMEDGYYNHMSAKEIKALVSEDVWNSYYKFSFDRNPYDKMVSLYFWRKGDEKYESFYDFLTNGGLRGFFSYDAYAIDNVVAVDNVYKYEEMDFFLKDLSERLDLAKTLELPTYRAKSKSRKIEGYREILDDKSVEEIKTLFAREIKLLGYDYKTILK